MSVVNQARYGEFTCHMGSHSVTCHRKHNTMTGMLQCLTGYDMTALYWLGGSNAP